MEKIIYPLSKKEKAAAKAAFMKPVRKTVQPSAPATIETTAVPAHNVRTPLRYLRNTWLRFQIIRINLGLFSTIITLLVGAQATLIWAPKVGLFVDVVAFMTLIVLALYRPDARQLLISLAVLPVASLVASSFYGSGITLLATTTIFYVTILLLAYVYRLMFTLDVPIAQTRLTRRGYFFAVPAMLVIGEIAGAVGYGFLHHQFPFHNTSVILLAACSIVFAYSEELFLRGLIQQRASNVFHPIVAAVLTSVLYVFLSIRHSSMLTIGPAIVLGLVLSFTYYKKQNLILTTLINATAKLTYLGLVASFILR